MYVHKNAIDDSTLTPNTIPDFRKYILCMKFPKNVKIIINNW